MNALLSPKTFPSVYIVAMEAIKQLFEDKLITDEREPVHVFSIPGLEGEYALYAPKSQLWNQLIFVSVFCP